MAQPISRRTALAALAGGGVALGGADDRLDPARSHGDVLISIASASQDVNLFALRQLMRSTRDGSPPIADTSCPRRSVG